MLRRLLLIGLLTTILGSLWADDASAAWRRRGRVRSGGCSSCQLR